MLASRDEEQPHTYRATIKAPSFDPKTVNERREQRVSSDIRKAIVRFQTFASEFASRDLQGHSARHYEAVV